MAVLIMIIICVYYRRKKYKKGSFSSEEDDLDRWMCISIIISKIIKIGQNILGIFDYP